MKTTIKDVAKAAGVSVAAVSMALNGRNGVSEKTRVRVMEVARQLNYIPNYSARSLVMQESNCIGLMIPEIQNPFYSEIVDIMTGIAEEKGYTLLLGITNNSSRQEEEYTRMFLSRGVVGVIVVPVLSRYPEAGHLNLLRAQDIPIVFCTEIYKGCSEPVVMCDFASGEYDATRYLIQKGLRDFWYVSANMDTNFTRRRYEGYVRALREAGIAVRPERELLTDTPGYREAYQVTERILKDLPEAVICINDIMTMAILKRLGEHGLRVPQDISVVGFDDIRFSELVSPPLTTVRQPVPEICRRTMELMEVFLRGSARQRAAEKEKVYLIRPELVIRGTTI